MERHNKFIQKSLLSFTSGKFYQGEKEFNAGLLRDIETNSFDDIESALNVILPILETNSLYHEAEQIIQYYLVHLKKHKALVDGIKPIVAILNANLSKNIYPNTIIRFFTALMDFLVNNQENDLITFIKSNYNDFIQNSSNFSFSRELTQKIFDTLVLLSLFNELETLAFSKFLNNINHEENLELILYSLIVLSINGKGTTTIDFLKDLRKKIPLEFQKESRLFQCCSEFILASNSKDYDWIIELQQHFSEILKDKILKILILNLIKTTFPEKSKISIFDFFKN